MSRLGSRASLLPAGHPCESYSEQDSKGGAVKVEHSMNSQGGRALERVRLRKIRGLQVDGARQANKIMARLANLIASDF